MGSVYKRQTSAAFHGFWRYDIPDDIAAADTGATTGGDIGPVGIVASVEAGGGCAHGAFVGSISMVLRGRVLLFTTATANTGGEQVKNNMTHGETTFTSLVFPFFSSSSFSKCIVVDSTYAVSLDLLEGQASGSQPLANAMIW